MLSSLLSFLVPQAYAQCDNTGAGNLDLGECLTLGVGAGKSIKDVYATPADLISIFVNLLFIVGGVIFFLLIIFSGFKFITGASKGKDEAKTIITAATVGLIVMFVAYWIVKILEVITGMDLIF